MTIYNFQCDPNTNPEGSRGVTTWDLSNPFTIPKNNGSVTKSFTCTIPQCYTGQDSCNICFDASADSNSTPDKDVSLTYLVNSANAGGCRISGIANHGGRQAFDITQSPNHPYDDDKTTPNTFTIVNNSPYTDVTISHFRVLRIYEMYNLGIDNAQMCDPPQTTGSNGNMDFVRVDKPCNYEDCGTWSVSQVADSSGLNQTIQPGNSFDWYFDWSNCSSFNYYSTQKCLLNFNQIWATQTNNNYGDVQLDAEINDEHFATYYLSNQEGNGMFPSYDLVENNSSYNHTGYNHLRLTNNGHVPVKFVEALNIYRIYNTYSPCGPYTNAYSDHSDVPFSNYSDHSDGYYVDGGHVDCGSGVATVILNVSGVMVTPPSVTFVVDNNNYSPDSVVCLTPGEHDFSVDSTTSDVYGNYTFAYFDVLDGGANHLYYVYDNPATIEVGSNFIVATYTMDQ